MSGHFNRHILQGDLFSMNVVHVVVEARVVGQSAIITERHVFLLPFFVQRFAGLFVQITLENIESLQNLSHFQLQKQICDDFMWK